MLAMGPFPATFRAPAFFRMNRLCFVSAVLLLGSTTEGWAQSQPKDSYLPQLVAGKSNEYRFTDEQLARMARSSLQADRFVDYIEHRWPLERLQTFCVPRNIWPEGAQNLVFENVKVSTDLFKGKKTGFDRIWVYVDQDDGQNTTYSGTTGTNWHRWIYSLNVQRGEKFWVIIETLPNDFMDSERYRVKE